MNALWAGLFSSLGHMWAPFLSLPSSGQNWHQALLAANWPGACFPLFRIARNLLSWGKINLSFAVFQMIKTQSETSGN